MARRLTTNQEIAGSIPASVTSFCKKNFLSISIFGDGRDGYIRLVVGWCCGNFSFGGWLLTDELGIMVCLRMCTIQCIIKILSNGAELA